MSVINKNAYEALKKACENFVSKVDVGKAKSVESYNEMKEALELTKDTGFSNYCIEVRRGIGEEDMVIHEVFSDNLTRSDVLHYLVREDIGYDDDYCKFNYYKV